MKQKMKQVIKSNFFYLYKEEKFLMRKEKEKGLFKSDEDVEKLTSKNYEELVFTMYKMIDETN